MAVNVELDFRNYLTATSLGGVAVFVGGARPAKPPAIPHKAIFVRENGGLPPSPYMDGNRTDYRAPRLTVHIRGNPNDYVGTKALADACLAALQKSTPTAYYVRVTVDSSAPYFWGYDDQECPEFSLVLYAEGRF